MTGEAKSAVEVQTQLPKEKKPQKSKVSSGEQVRDDYTRRPPEQRPESPSKR